MTTRPSTYKTILVKAEKALGKFYCVSCKINRPSEMKVKRGHRTMCVECLAKQLKPRKMTTSVKKGAT